MVEDGRLHADLFASLINDLEFPAVSFDEVALAVHKVIFERSKQHRTIRVPQAAFPMLLVQLPLALVTAAIRSLASATTMFLRVRHVTVIMLLLCLCKKLVFCIHLLISLIFVACSPGFGTSAIKSFLAAKALTVGCKKGV